jgi:hypothetical protein
MGSHERDKPTLETNCFRQESMGRVRELRHFLNTRRNRLRLELSLRRDRKCAGYEDAEGYGP